uniref:HAMP domain-containing protein n=1 Tax=Klebsiella pneumoniae TaxID=573 RepID=UPI0013D7440C
NATAEAIIDGDLSRRVDRDDTPNEFDKLAETLNRMLYRIGGLLDNLRQVTTDIAHDLRTPLARQKQILEAALDT